MFLKSFSDGFLLIELMVAMIIGLFLFSIGIYWKDAILTTYHETQKRLETLQVVHNILNQIQSDPQYAHKSSHDREDIHITWKLVNYNIEFSDIPFIKPPKYFKFINLDVSWQGSKSKRSTKLVAGINNA